MKQWLSLHLTLGSEGQRYLRKKETNEMSSISVLSYSLANIYRL